MLRPKLKKINRWEFKNDGANTFWIGEWNKNDKTMTWDFIDFSGNGIIGQIISRRRRYNGCYWAYLYYGISFCSSTNFWNEKT